ncbi:unnamed protein product [Adineta steineri]|uniref:Fibronectin type-III domain-containing protein n=1 Tax=Adineta steineri TaxID=433720 RepID=A0A814LF97_9BILA|nr:unnamed protein product [Adineta steineri]CAF1063944.1 unnamed protein product [Adineta steineri]
MANVDNNKFYFDRKNYFLRFVSNEEKSDINHGINNNLNSTSNSMSRNIRHALEYFVDDLRRDSHRTIEKFLNEQTVNDILRSIAQLLLNEDDRICGNSAYIMGSTVGTELGLTHFFTAFSRNRTSNTVDIVQVLCKLLTHSDSECVLNAAGTLGTICGSKEGRDLLLNHTCINQLIINTSSLLSSTNSWIASNVGLILARITVEEIGCKIILTHSKHREILNQILSALDISDPGRSTNAAFAIGRLIEGDDGKKTLISDCGQYKIFDALLLMLEVNEEKGVNKNACYALSCLCTTQFGFQLCLQYLPTFHRIILAIETLLISIEHETVWFALMCLRTIAGHDGASEHILRSKTIIDKLKQIRDKWNKYQDIQEEARGLWYLLHRNIKPNRPKIDECRNTSAEISWDINVNSWDDAALQFRIILNNQSIGVTNTTNYSLKDLQPNTNYNVQIQYITPQGENIRSDPTIFHTDDELPPPVNNLHVERATMTAVRVSWDSPDLSACNLVKGYQTYLNDVEHERTTECVITIGSLSASTTYKIDVCVVTSKGNGPRASINVVTASTGDSNPAPPTFSVIGRREIHIKWQPPEVIAGRFTRYELYCNRQDIPIYSGQAQEFHATMLKSDTAYTMEVVAITNEGRFRSKPAKTRTLKDEFNAQRHSLYELQSQSPPRVKRTESNHSLYFPTNTNAPKASPPPERRLSRETNVSNRNVDITSVQPIQLKSENPTNSRVLPVLARGVQPRPQELIKRRNTQRFRTEPVSMNHLQPPTTRITPSRIVPNPEFNREHQVRWAIPVVQKIPQTTPYRLASVSESPSIIPDLRRSERSASNSIPDLSLNLPRTQSLSQT